MKYIFMVCPPVDEISSAAVSLKMIFKMHMSVCITKLLSIK